MELGKRDVEKIVEEQVEAFEEALLERVRLVEPTPRTILLALDHSNQDSMTTSLGAEIGRRYNAVIAVTGGFPDEMEEEARSYLSEASHRLREEGVDARTLWAPEKKSFDKILWAQRESGADILILPAPYFRDIETLGEDSIGTNLDIILARSPIPVLVIRNPGSEPEEVLDRIHLAIFDHTPPSQASAEWAILLAGGGSMDVLALVEEKFVEMMEEALASEGITEEDLEEGLVRSLVPLVSAVLRRCDELDVPCDVDYVTADLVDTITKRAGRRRGMIVLRGYEARDRPGEKVAREVILRSRVPVMVVKEPTRS